MAQIFNNEELTRYLGTLSEAQNSKMDRNGNNAATTCAGIVQALKEAGCSIVIKSWIDPEKPTDGYRIWSNGYCEQWGGFGAAYNGYTTKTINLIKKYVNASYNITLTPGNTANSYVPVVSAKSVDNFTAINTVNYNSLGSWRTCGYLAEGQY